MTIDISDYSVMKKQCSTCPFRTDEQGRHLDVELVGKIQQQCLMEASQICHHQRRRGEEERRLCRGARDYQLQIFHRLGMLAEPTDKEWERFSQSFE